MLDSQPSRAVAPAAGVGRSVDRKRLLALCDVLRVETLGAREIEQGRRSLAAAHPAIYVPFVFSDITPTSFRFEQAFPADGARNWDVNWEGMFTR